MSSAWWLGQDAMLGLAASRTPQNIARAIQVRIVRSVVDDALLVPGTAYIDPRAWDPLIMKFCDFFGGAMPVVTSRLAAGWQIPGRFQGAA
jgi:hypothetical protein